MRFLEGKSNQAVVLVLSIIVLIIGSISSSRLRCFYDCSIYQILKFYFISILIYIFPGYCLSRLFAGSLRNNIFVYILGSLVALPVILTFSGLFLETSFSSIALPLAIFYILCRFADEKMKNKLKLKDTHEEKNKKILIIYWLVFMIFLIMVIAPRFNLLTERYSSVGDDYSKLAMITSIVSSGIPPSYYNYPSTPLVYYYYGYVQAGLITRLTDNFITVSQAWFLHVLIQTVVSIWLIIQVVKITIKTISGRLLAISLMTFLGGYEYSLYNQVSIRQ